MLVKLQKLVIVIGLVLIATTVYSQKDSPKRFPSLFWEITGNGLAKPSYLFGTMHVSNKMVFHLSDSFYIAMKNVDAVALELNPDIWQGKMVRLDETKQNYGRYVKPAGGDLLTENSFRISKYEEELKSALSTEPTVVNSLLYRTYKNKEDFEEDTFLDLYIFQTGKKFGKRSAGVEDFNETEKIVLQAYADMATEKKKKTIDTDGESMRDITKKVQDAYRRGDLDMMDSLDIMTERSAAFREKFLYLRNEVQANSIDTIMQKSSLFVGVGAAHLPGNRGVIELLRKKGYTLRPIIMLDNISGKQDETDKLKVPVIFTRKLSDDGFYSVDMPGPLFKMTEDNQQLDRRQYADMSNGSYYLVTRVNTHGAFLGLSEEDVLNKIDSMLYENIPGKIINKALLFKNGYRGYDITNRTRRGDRQRYNIFITPFEVLIFKMSGKENYVDGEEANHFFSSVQLKPVQNNAVKFTPEQGGFTVNFPQFPHQYMDNSNSDGIDCRQYEAVDKASGDGYLILNKTVYNFKFLSEDSFDVKLIEESFRSPDFFDKQLQRKYFSYKGYPCLDVKEKMKDGSFVTARYLIKGPQYFIIAARSKNIKKDFSEYLNSFQLMPYNYTTDKTYIDSFMHFAVKTAVMPDLDNDYRNKLEQVSKDVADSKAYASYDNYWPKSRNAIFKSDSTGEMISVTFQQYAKYYYVKDSAKFWDTELADYFDKKDMQLYKKNYFLQNNGVTGYKFTLRDSGSSRTINRVSLLKDDYMFSMATMGDTLNKRSVFVDSFFESFTPYQKYPGRNIFNNNLNSFFTDLFSKDSSVASKAVKYISNVYFGEKGVPGIMNALQKLKPTNKDYVAIKTKLIAELGIVNDSVKPVVVNYLQTMYEQTADTSIFQNEIMEALANHKTSQSIQLFKTLVLQNPPVFEKDYEYLTLFSHLQDSLALAATLYPEILQLTTLQDYKEPIINLLVKLVDSGYVNADRYKNYFNNIYFDAKIALKKQQGKDEKKAEADKKSEDGEEDNAADGAKNYSMGFRGNIGNEELDNYAILLMPFYDSLQTVKIFFNKLLKSGNVNVSLNTAVILLRNKKYVADSVLNYFAAKDITRSRLFSKLEKINKLDRFPAAYYTQIDVARSLLIGDKNFTKMDSIAFINKKMVTYEHKRGNVYFFKYRLKKGDDWKIGISGLQPQNSKEVNCDDKLALMTDKKIKTDRSLNDQLEEQLKKLLFSTQKSAKNFYEDEGNNYHYKKGGDYED